MVGTFAAMDRRWFVGPYIYPGLKGTPFNPAPSIWPSPNTVSECCCEAFNRAAHQRTYRIAPIVSTDDLRGPETFDMLKDMRAMCTHILFRHCMWLPAPGEVPRPYSYDIIGSYFGRSRYSAIRSHNRAMNLLETSPQFRSMFQQLQQLLASKGYHPQQISR